MKLVATPVAGCFALQLERRTDDRGFFLKTYHEEIFQERGLRCDFREQYYSGSRQGVVRGMHFQLPPHAHAKLIHCLSGALFDVVLDLRVGSPSYGKAATFALSAETPMAVYIPIGCAHGFCATSAEAVMLYNVTSVYAPAADAGVHWQSVPVTWPVAPSAAIVSPRDQGFPPWQAFSSPFTYPTE